jgi:predicted N-acetyltransferase YhbS
MIVYKVENDLTVDEFRKVLISSKLGERRPVDDFVRLEKMLRGANLIITARDNNEIVGVARSISDFSYCTYLSDLAVDEKYQKKGIGKELLRQTKKETGEAKLILLSAPVATDYYPKIGMKNHPFCYFIDDISEINE